MISVVIPVLNGEKTVPRVVANLLKMGRNQNLDLEIILVDDASVDDSARIIHKLASELPQVRALKNSERKGQQETLLSGLAVARGEILVTMDDDAQHDPEEIPALIGELEKGCDLVYGVFKVPEAGTVRTLGSKMRDTVFLHLYPVLGENRVGSFRAFTRELHEAATERRVRFSYISCLHLNQRPKVANVRMGYKTSERDRSNYNMLSLIRLLVRIYWYYGPGAKFNFRRNDSCE